MPDLKMFCCRKEHKNSTSKAKYFKLQDFLKVAFEKSKRSKKVQRVVKQKFAIRWIFLRIFKCYDISCFVKYNLKNNIIFEKYNWNNFR